ncbi:MAG: glycosyltransferase family 2 protein [Rubripirellula sp.]|nr:glycosyltransferase family 2 protein [Rubripirellula sp.]
MVSQPKSISIILSTYNAPEWLEKSLWGYSVQSVKPKEIIVADDGSDERTEKVIDRVRARTGLKIKHVWHQDNGFQKCVILNRAIAESSSDYLIFSDGDCIPRRDFVQQHQQRARPYRFLSGGYNKLPMELSRQITLDDISSGDAFQLNWLLCNGLKVGRQELRLKTKGLVSEALNRITTTNPTWNGHNASGWKTDLVQVNGFDERMRYGGEDCELGERLAHSGITPIQIRFSAICLHLDHARGYVNDRDKKRNWEIRQFTRRHRLMVTEYGLKQSNSIAA